VNKKELEEMTFAIYIVISSFLAVAGSTGATNMNATSSRSHAIFTVTVECSEKGADGEQHVRVGKLHLVDLAVGIFFPVLCAEVLMFKAKAQSSLTMCKQIHQYNFSFIFFLYMYNILTQASGAIG
jgi:hypothetical protein